MSSVKRHRWRLGPRLGRGRRARRVRGCCSLSQVGTAIPRSRGRESSSTKGPVPAFRTLPSLTGRPTRSSFRGPSRARVVLVNFWNSWWHPVQPGACRASLSSTGLAPETTPGFAMVGIVRRDDTPRRPARQFRPASTTTPGRSSPNPQGSRRSNRLSARTGQPESVHDRRARSRVGVQAPLAGGRSPNLDEIAGPSRRQRPDRWDFCGRVKTFRAVDRARGCSSSSCPRGHVRALAGRATRRPPRRRAAPRRSCGWGPTCESESGSRTASSLAANCDPSRHQAAAIGGPGKSDGEIRPGRRGRALQRNNVAAEVPRVRASDSWCGSCRCWSCFVRRGRARLRAAGRWSAPNPGLAATDADEAVGRARRQGASRDRGPSKKREELEARARIPDPLARGSRDRARRRQNIDDDTYETAPRRTYTARRRAAVLRALDGEGR